MNIKLMLPVVLLSSLSLISCGGGSSEPTGYTGSTAQATVTSTNKDALAVAATAGAGQAVVENSAQNAIPVLRPSPVSSFILNLSSQIKQQLTTARRTANQPVLGICQPGFGSVDITSNQDGTQFTLVFINCMAIQGNGEVVNGTVFVTIDSINFNSITMRFVNFTVLYLGETYDINMTVVCDNFGCAWSSDFTGPDGRTYRTVNAEISFLGLNSFNVNATVYDPDHGFIGINGSVNYATCAGGVPQSGSLTFTGSAGSSGSVTFDSCDSFTVTVDGVPTEYFWADLLI